MLRYFSIVLVLSSPATLTAKDLRFQLITNVPGQRVFFVSELSEWNDSTYKMDENTPGNYSLILPKPWLPKLRYKFIVDGKWIIDPTNSEIESDGYGGYNSVIKNAEFREDPLLRAQDGVPQWKHSALKIRDFEGDMRTIIILSPPASFHKKRFVTAYFHDGQDYLDRAGIANLVANLSIKQSMPAIAAVLISPKDRRAEYALTERSELYAKFLAENVVSVVEDKLLTNEKITSRVLIGPSLGGLITTYIALRYSHIFGFAASQSGSFQINTQKILALLERPAYQGSPLHLFHDIGLYEGPNILEANRKVYKVAKASGYDIAYHELPTIHQWVTWRNRLSPIFQYFFENTP